MADDNEIAAVWNLAGRYLVRSLETDLKAPRLDWRNLSDCLSRIPESGTAAYLPSEEHFEDGDFLVIAYRAQNGVAVSIRLAERSDLDPPVFASDNEDGAPRTQEFKSASDWFCVETLWSLVNEGRGVTGHAGSGGRAAKKRILSSYVPMVPAAKSVKLEFFGQGSSAVVCISGKEVYAWAESERAWELMSEQVGVSWDYCTLDDEA